MEELLCLVCREYLTPPVVQCMNSHYYCKICVNRTNLYCVQCESRIHIEIRNFSAEKALATHSIPCKWENRGCPKLMTPLTRLEHEVECQHSFPFTCKITWCNYSSTLPNLLSHLKTTHSIPELPHSSSFHILFTFPPSPLQKYRLLTYKNYTFLLSHCYSSETQLLSYELLAFTRAFPYTITTQNNGFCLALQSTTPTTPSLSNTLILTLAQAALLSLHCPEDSCSYLSLHIQFNYY